MFIAHKLAAPSRMVVSMNFTCVMVAPARSAALLLEGLLQQLGKLPAGSNSLSNELLHLRAGGIRHLVTLLLEHFHEFLVHEHGLEHAAECVDGGLLGAWHGGERAPDLDQVDVVLEELGF